MNISATEYISHKVRNVQERIAFPFSYPYRVLLDTTMFRSFSLYKTSSTESLLDVRSILSVWPIERIEVPHKNKLYKGDGSMTELEREIILTFRLLDEENSIKALRYLEALLEGREEVAADLLIVAEVQ